MTILIRTFITNQEKLAKAVGISSVHLSNVKNGKTPASERFATALEKVTDIPQIDWLAPARKALRRNQLKEFFRKERMEELKSINQEAENDGSTTPIRS